MCVCIYFQFSSKIGGLVCSESRWMVKLFLCLTFCHEVVQRESQVPIRNEPLSNSKCDRKTNLNILLEIKSLLQSMWACTSLSDLWQFSCRVQNFQYCWMLRKERVMSKSGLNLDVAVRLISVVAGKLSMSIGCCDFDWKQ